MLIVGRKRKVRRIMQVEKDHPFIMAIVYIITFTEEIASLIIGFFMLFKQEYAGAIVFFALPIAMNVVWNIIWMKYEEIEIDDSDF
jgi:hypothetical protein